MSAHDASNASRPISERAMMAVDANLFSSWAQAK
jgi:hypothetical protein